MRSSRTAVLLTACLSLFCFAEVNAQASPPVPAPAQELLDPFSLGPKTSGNYLAPLEVLRPLRKQYLSSSRWRSAYFEDLAAYESFVGNDAEAVADFDLARPPDDDLTDKDALAAVKAFNGYQPTDARQAILKLAKTHPVIFINEAHHVPMGRAFTLSLLPGLYAQGFRYFAAETLDEKDTALQGRGYPTQKTGYYTTEPTFGDLVRTALKLGFKVIPYEYQLKPSQSFSKSPNPFADEDLRERGEAQNLYNRIFKHDPHAKILLHAGYGHISKKVDTATWTAGDLGTKTSGTAIFTPMAVYFERLSGIVPLSIDQSNLYPHSAPAYEKLLYRKITDRELVQDKPVAFQNAGGHYYVSSLARGVYDFIVCHPPVSYQNGRPDWLQMNGRRSFVSIPADFPQPKDAEHTLLVQAFYVSEDAKRAVPIDQVELRPNVSPQPKLLLPRGKFLVQVVDGTGTVLGRRQITQP